jgi:hypothetical protein
VVIKALVTEFEYEKLRALAEDRPFMVQFHNSMIEELNRLDAIRYIQPKPGYGIESVRERDGTDKMLRLNLIEPIHTTLADIIQRCRKLWMRPAVF